MIQGQGRLNPGSDMLEAETLAASAVASSGQATSGKNGAKDVFSSGDAYLAWNAGRVGETLDVFVRFPKSRFVRLWYHRVLFFNGGVFNIDFLPIDSETQTRRIAQSDEDFRSRILGQSQSASSINCYNFWPHRQAYRFMMPIVRNPAPGRLGRIRFTCTTKAQGSRGYMLAVDQIGIEAAPSTPSGWVEFESVSLHKNQMHQGHPDFFGWGGVQLAHASSKQRDSVVTICRLTAAKASSTFTLRGLIKSGSWKAQVVDSSSPIELTQPKPNSPTEWNIALRTPMEGPLSVKLIFKCTSEKGLLWLDAWRTE
jgi:hypothetical protein